MKSVIVMTVVSNVPPHWQPALDEIFPAPAGFCWRFVPESPLAVQFRSVLRMDARAVVVWVGEDDAIHRAVRLINRLLQAGLPIVIAIAEVHNAGTESLLRQAGAVYFCANEAQLHLGGVLRDTLRPPPRLTGGKLVESVTDIKMDAG